MIFFKNNHKYIIRDGDNKIILSKENATNKDRLYAGDIWLVPVTTSKSRYAGVDVEAVEFWNSSTKELDALNGDEKVFKAIESFCNKVNKDYKILMNKKIWKL